MQLHFAQHQPPVAVRITTCTDFWASHLQPAGEYGYCGEEEVNPFNTQ